MTNPATILIVDDHAPNRDTLMGLLENADYRLVEAADGPEALKLAADLHPDLILLDVMMPEMDGFEVCRRLRAHPRLAEVPVIMVTALGDRESRITGIGCGADDFISKPYDHTELRTRVKTITRLNRYGRLLRERAKVEEANQKVREQAALIDLATDAIVVLDTDGRVQSWNSGAEIIFGTAEGDARGRPLAALISKGDSARLDKALAETNQAGEWRGDLLAFRPAGGNVIVHSHWTRLRKPDGSTHGILTVSTDQTEFKKLQAQFYRAQRMDSLGTLAGGIAHDLNNALGPIMMAVELLKMPCPDEADILETMEKSTMRAVGMVRQLLTFAKGSEGERNSIQLFHLVREMEKIMKGAFPKNIELQVRLTEKLPTVLGDATQLHQVLLNLCVNARDAMPHGGTLTIEAKPMDVDAAFAGSLRMADAQPGRYLALRVTDTGTGIPPEILDRIFDPFFTTKVPDKGTGLGLSTVMGIVKGHGGFLQVSSQPGCGSTFSAFLPVEKQQGHSNEDTRVHSDFQGKGETILYVDDEVAMRDVARAVLGRLNFTPMTATDGADALVQVAQNRTTLRAIITDMHMPHMDGLTLARMVRRMLPNIPMVVASGRLEDHLAAEFKMLGVHLTLDKPFTQDQMAEVLRAALKGAKSPRA